MRDPARIPRMIEKLRAFWLTHPDLRLGQLIHNAGSVSHFIHGTSADDFNLEDDDMEKALDSLLTGEIPL